MLWGNRLSVEITEHGKTTTNALYSEPLGWDYNNLSTGGQYWGDPQWGPRGTGHRGPHYAIANGRLDHCAQRGHQSQRFARSISRQGSRSLSSVRHHNVSFQDIPSTDTGDLPQNIRTSISTGILRTQRSHGRHRRFVHGLEYSDADGCAGYPSLIIPMAPSPLARCSTIPVDIRVNDGWDNVSNESGTSKGLNTLGSHSRKRSVRQSRATAVVRLAAYFCRPEQCSDGRNCRSLLAVTHPMGARVTYA